MKFRIAIRAESLNLPFRRALPLIASLGAEGIEFDARGELAPRSLSRTGRRQLRKSLDDMGLKVACVGFPTRRGYEVVEDLDRRIEATKEAMQMAYELGASVVSNSMGFLAPTDDDASRQVLRESLLDLGRYAQTCGAWLVARTGSCDGRSLAEFLSGLPDGTLGVDFDPAGLLVNGHAVDEAFSCLLTRIMHVHARDAVRDVAVGRGVDVTLGRGGVDFSQIARRLDEQGYRGYFTVDPREARDPTTAATNAVTYLGRLRGT